MRAMWVLLSVLLVAGCMSPAAPKGDEGDDTLPYFKSQPIVPVRERANVPFRTDGTYSYVLENGTLPILPPLSVLVDVEVPLGNGLPTQQVHMGVFLPKVPDGTKVPVIADVGPYYGDGDVHATQPANRLGAFLIENFVPHGYAVAQVSVLGTGDSGGCMDLMGEVEQAGIQAAVDWLGTQPWSNGNVGLIGRSYDGSTPWEAAMKGSPHLKTVVPISGLYGQHELMWRNGSAETRGPGVLWALYFAFAYTGNEETNPEFQARQAAENTICPDTLVGPAEGLQAYATADPNNEAAHQYWAERSFREEVLANYKGSVYFIHGLQDWNVDPHMAFPFYQELEAKGLEMKGLFGQWGHMYPDRPNEHRSLPTNNGKEAYPESVRWDWAEDLLEWFEHYLKGTGPKPELHVEVQDADGTWRIEGTYPPRDLAWKEFKLGELAADSENASAITPCSTMRFTSEKLAEDLRIAGLAQLHIQATPTGPGGQLYAELRDLDQGGRRLGHAIMDLRNAAGGDETRPVTPGMPLVARMEFEPLDILVPTGHRLELFVAGFGRDYLPATVSAPVLIEPDASVLRLPTIVRSETAFFQPPAWTPAPPPPPSEGGGIPLPDLPDVPDACG